MARGTLEIGTYQPPVTTEVTGIQSNVAVSPLARLRSKISDPIRARHSGATLGALASLLIHTLLITGLVWGGGHLRMPSPQRQDLGSEGAANSDGGEFTMVLVPVDETESSHEASPALSSFFVPSLTTVRLDSAVAKTDPPPISTGDATEESQSVEDSVTNSVLVGRYVGQIDARIERAWSRPRNSLKEGLFSCQVRIEQDQTGSVREVAVEHCNGDTRWRMSLIQAIERASPLPAPPDPKVFKRLLRLKFQAQPYSPGVAEELYESAEIARRSPVVP